MKLFRVEYVVTDSDGAIRTVEILETGWGVPVKQVGDMVSELKKILESENMGFEDITIGNISTMSVLKKRLALDNLSLEDVSICTLSEMMEER